MIGICGAFGAGDARGLIDSIFQEGKLVVRQSRLSGRRRHGCFGFTVVAKVGGAA